MATMGLSRAVSEINDNFSRKSLIFPPTPVFNPPMNRFPLKLDSSTRVRKTRMMGLPGRERSLTISSAVWIQYANVTDRRTDGHRATAKSTKTSLTHSGKQTATCCCVAVTCVRLVSQLINTSLTDRRTAVNVTCDVTRTFADKRQSTSLVSVCDDKGHWTPAVPDCVGRYSALVCISPQIHFLPARRSA